MTTLPMTVREARDRRKKPLTQEELADKSGVDQTYISLIERGLRNPSDDIKRKLAKALGLAPSRLRFSGPQPEVSLDQLSDSAGQNESVGDRRGVA